MFELCHHLLLLLLHCCFHEGEHVLLLFLQGSLLLLVQLLEVVVQELSVIASLSHQHRKGGVASQNLLSEVFALHLRLLERGEREETRGLEVGLSSCNIGVD